MTAAEYEVTRYLAQRRRQVFVTELRRSYRFSHAALEFGDGGSWTCTCCGAEGLIEQSPTHVPCVT
jgi:hypothetical protein